jgi:hypothetical protein
LEEGVVLEGAEPLALGGARVAAPAADERAAATAAVLLAAPLREACSADCDCDSERDSEFDVLEFRARVRISRAASVRGGS